MKHMRKTTVASLILLVVIIVTGVAVYTGTRETRVTVKCEGFDQPLSRLAVSIALGDIKAVEEIRRQFLSALEPRRQQLVEIDKHIADINETLAGLESKKTEFEQILVTTGEQFETKASEAWNSASEELQAEYETKRAEYMKRFEERAGQLQLDFRQPKLESVDAYSSSFRLGLYNVGTNVNAMAERQWADELFREWTAYEEDWQRRMDKAMIKGRVIDDRKRVELAKMKTEAPVIENKREPLERQRARLQLERDQIQAFLDNAADPYMERILSVYRATAVKTLTVDTKGEAVFDHLDIAPGPYFIIVEQSTEAGPKLWRVPFLIRAKQDNLLVVRPDGGKLLRQILDDGP